MSKELLHTPEGVRDVYGKECARKLTIENKINNIFNLYGFHNVQTPTFEFFDILCEINQFFLFYSTLLHEFWNIN